MKKILIITLALVMLLSLAACKKDPEPTTPTIETTEPVVETQPIDIPPEIIPDIPDETMPPVLTDDMTGADLRNLYANFMRDYDWAQHNGFMAETPSINFTYVFLENGYMQDIKRLSELYEGSYVSRYTKWYTNNMYYEFLMCDDGSFGYQEPREEAPPYCFAWQLYNETTVSDYIRTDVSDKIYDIVKFETTWGAPVQILEYTVRDTKTDAFYIVTVSDEGLAYVYSIDGGEYIFENVTFDPATKKLSINSQQMNVEIVRWPDEASTVSSAIVVRGMLYVDRETQTAVYFEDLDRGTIVHFLTNATIDFTMPNNVNPDLATQDSEILYAVTNYESDVRRYLTSEAR